MKKLLCMLSFFITFLSCILLMLIYWLYNTFGSISFETIMFTLATPMKQADHTIISSFVWNVIILSFIVTAVLFIPCIVHIFNYKIKYIDNIKRHIVLHYTVYFSLLITIMLSCIFFNLTIQKKFKKSQFYTSVKDNITYISYCTTIESIKNKTDDQCNYIYYHDTHNQFYDIENKQNIKAEIVEQLKSILETHPNLILFLPISNEKPQNLEFLLKVLPFPKQLAIECSNLWWYKEAKRCGILYPILSLDNIPKNHFKQIFHKNISLLSCSDKILSNNEYHSIIKELHYRGATIFLHSKKMNDKSQYGVLFDAIITNNDKK